MFGIGMPEMILILAVALIVIGPKKLPDLAKSLGKAMREFKKATSDLKESMQIDTELTELKSTFKEVKGDEKKASPTNPDKPNVKTVDAAVSDAHPDEKGTALDGDATASAGGDSPGGKTDVGLETPKG